jgi:ABC-type lipoprotein export system ATPase subunit
MNGMPTSNLDTLNKAVILKVLRDEGAGRTVAVVWVCHVVYFVFGVKTIRKEE